MVIDDVPAHLTTSSFQHVFRKLLLGDSRRSPYLFLTFELIRSCLFDDIRLSYPLTRFLTIFLLALADITDAIGKGFGDLCVLGLLDEVLIDDWLH